MKTLRVGKFPGVINEYAVEDGATVGQVLEIAGLDHSGHQIQLDGNVVGLEDTITNGNLLVLAKQVKGA